MKEMLRVLHLEDDRMHADLARALLAEDGIEYDLARVETEADFIAALDAGQTDLILADFTLPEFDGMTALAMARARLPDAPFIFVTGTMGEETAIEALKQGATDYIIKNRLSRLAPAVRRALSESEEKTARGRAEAAQRLEREMLEMVTANIGAGLTLIAADFRIIWANGILSRRFGAVEGKICHETYQGRATVCPGCGVREIFATGKERVVCEHAMQDANGDTIWVEKTVTPVRDRDGTLVAALELVLPVTERKVAEEELRHSNEMFRALIQASPLAIFVLNPDGTVKLWNPAAERTFGWSEDDVRGGPLPIIPHDKQDDFALHCNRVLQGQPMTRKEVQRQRKDGALIDISLHAAPIFDAQGKAVAILVMVTDITERKRLDRELAQSERKFRTAFEDAAVGICLTGIDHRFLVVNRSLCKMLGYTAEELAAMDWVEVTHPDDREKCRIWSDEIFIGKQHGSPMEKRYLHKEGRVIWAMVSKVLLRDADGTPLYFINQVQDITEQKNLENQLRHAQKMEALGTLSGGIAHDFNNILTAIIGYGSLLDMKLDKNDPSRPFIEHILSAAERAVSLTQSLLTFGKKQAGEPRVVDLNRVVQGVEPLLLRLLREDVELRTMLAATPCMVMADAGQIGQVLMNLSTNARDAMSNGGKLAMATAAINLDRDFVALHGYGVPGRYALLTVTDTGVGMDTATRDRIFEPFFTTKEVGKGTGLGLSMAYGIVKQHNGYITCYSEPGAGTTFRIYLPIVNALAEPVLEPFAVLPPGGTETILLAEDDEPVRNLTARLLERYGYTVIEAIDGNDALTRFLAHQAVIQFALLDVIMPGRNGREVYEEMRKKKPELKALFTSGYSADIFQQGELGQSDFAFISKPALPAELLGKIRQVLDA